MITSAEGEVLPFRSPTNKSVSSTAARTAPPPVAFACSAIGSAVDSRPEGGGDRRHFADDQRAMAVVCSADWQSAVSRIGNPQGAHDAAHFAGWQPAIQQTNCLRYASGVCDAAFVFQPVTRYAIGDFRARQMTGTRPWIEITFCFAANGALNLFGANTLPSITRNENAWHEIALASLFPLNS